MCPETARHHFSDSGLSPQRESRLNLDFASHASLYLELGVFLPLFGDFLARKPFYEKCLIVAARKIISNHFFK